MEPRHGRTPSRARRAATLALIGAAALVAVACNPRVGLESVPYGATSSHAGSYAVSGLDDGGGWVEIDVRSGDATDVSVALAYVGLENPWYAPFPSPGRDPLPQCVTDGADHANVVGPCSHPDPSDAYTYSSRAVWSGGVSLGYRRLVHVYSGDFVDLQLTGSAGARTFDLRVVDDDGALVASAELRGRPGQVGRPIR